MYPVSVGMRRIRRAGISSRRPDCHALMHLFSGHRTVGEHQAGLDVLRFKNGVFLQNQPRGIARRQHAQDMLYGDAHVADDGLAVKDVRVDGDAFEQFFSCCQGPPTPSLIAPCACLRAQVRPVGTADKTRNGTCMVIFPQIGISVHCPGLICFTTDRISSTRRSMRGQDAASNTRIW